MTFTDIRLQNFRSYDDTSFEIGTGVNIVVGPNAAGKTNLIEALMLAAIGQTYKSEENLIKDTKPWARIDVHTDQNDQRSVKILAGPKQIKEFELEQKTYKRFPYSKSHAVVLFEPNDLMLIHGEPSGRRKFVDDILSQLSSDYKTILGNYKRTLSQRNSLLKQDSGIEKQIFVWDVRLAELAGEIVEKRLALLASFNKQLGQTYSVIAKTPTKLEMHYSSKISHTNYSSKLLKGLEESLNIDRARGFTGLGPHRDDIVFEMQNKKDASLASRGEARSLVLALKIIQLSLLEEKLGVKPLLLLDDVFSELDGQRRKSLTQHLKNHQTIITTTDADVLAKNFAQKTQTIYLN